MKHNQYAEIKFKNGASMYVNTDYITSYAYLKDNDETIISTLGGQDPVYFPGNQTKEIENAINRLGTARDWEESEYGIRKTD